MNNNSVDTKRETQALQIVRPANGNGAVTWRQLAMWIPIIIAVGTLFAFSIRQNALQDSRLESTAQEVAKMSIQIEKINSALLDLTKTAAENNVLLLQMKHEIDNRKSWDRWGFSSTPTATDIP